MAENLFKPIKVIGGVDEMDDKGAPEGAGGGYWKEKVTGKKLTVVAQENLCNTNDR